MELDDRELHVWRFAWQAGQQSALWVRAVLAEYLNCDPHALRLQRGEHGRPHLLGDELHFSLSHSGSWLLLAVARSVRPGIDLEMPRPRLRALAIARRYFSASEATWLAELAPVQLEPAFYRLWTAREAVVKALGRGIAYGFGRMQFALEADSTRLLALDGDDPGAWQIRQLDLCAGGYACLAWRGAALHWQCIDGTALDRQLGLTEPRQLQA